MVLNFDVGKDKNKNRDKLEIVKDMLLIASIKVRKTKMMYQANLSYLQVEKYLKSLLERDLLECVGDSYYLITNRGKAFLQMYADYIERCRRIGDEVNGARKDRLLLASMCFNDEIDLKRAVNRREVLVQY